jgi:hypothetical protein
MAHFAEIDSNNIVTRVLVVDDLHQADGANYLANELGLGGTWIQTSYNTRGGVHYGTDNKPDGGNQIGFNYAGIGYLWDGVGFCSPQPYPSWRLNKECYFWEAPTPMPTDGKLYNWDETTLAWVEVAAPTA